MGAIHKLSKYQSNHTSKKNNNTVLLLIILLPKECPENTPFYEYFLMKGLSRNTYCGDHKANQKTAGLPATAGYLHMGRWEKRCDNSQKDGDAEAMSQLSPHYGQDSVHR